VCGVQGSCLVTELGGAKGGELHGALGLALLGLGDILGSLGEDDLNVRGAALVGVDATVSAVSAAALLGGTVDLDVRDDELLSVKVLGLRFDNRKIIQ